MHKAGSHRQIFFSFLLLHKELNIWNRHYQKQTKGTISINSFENKLEIYQKGKILWDTSANAKTGRALDIFLLACLCP